MEWSLLLAFFFLWCTGANSQYTLTQPAAQSFPPGQPAKISCTMSRDSQVGSYSIYWYQQKAGERPKYLLYNTGSSGRFTGSKDASANAAYLTVTNLQAEDEADYYCGGGYGSGSNYRWVFGGGTQLTVTGQPPVSPSVQVFGPSEQEIKTQKKATLVCLLSGFHPPAFELKWKVDGTETTSGVETTKATKQGDKYLASSYLTRSDSNYGDHTYVCEVKHNGETFTKALTGSGSC